jgi:hypothetical protein
VGDIPEPVVSGVANSRLHHKTTVCERIVNTDHTDKRKNKAPYLQKSLFAIRQ